MQFLWYATPGRTLECFADTLGYQSLVNSQPGSILAPAEWGGVLHTRIFGSGTWIHRCQNFRALVAVSTGIYKGPYRSCVQANDASRLSDMVTTTADKALANRYNEEYTYKVWWFVVSFLLLVGVTHYASVALRTLALGKKEPTDVEADGRLVRSSASIRRLPLAVVNAYRVLAFRTTFIIGPYSLNLAEVAITVAYIIVLFVLSFINSMCPCSRLIHDPNISRTATALDGSKFSLTYYMNRTAYIACGQLPFVVALGTKNNFVGCEFYFSSPA